MPEINAKAPLRQRAMRELKELVLISLYLYVTLGAVLHAEGINFSPWGLAIVKAVVLAKFMLLGEAMKIGEHTTRPLIWPTLQKAFALLVLLIILTIIEEVVVGLFHHHSIATSLSELGGPRLEETLAGFVVMLLVLIPYCAFRVLDVALGEGRLARMFFVHREPMERR
jgi:predicted ferric reductase